jgi:hypothetical protein
MVTIASSTLRANVYETVYDILTSAYLLSSTVDVVASYKDTMTDFPYVVVNPISINKSNPTYDRTSMENTIIVKLDVYTRKKKEIDQISDEIDNLTTLKHITGLRFDSTDESIDFSPVNDNKIHNKSIILNYVRR